MCVICNGMTEQESDATMQTMIDVHGYYIQMVRGPDHPEWSYTIGLQEAIGHPDLICIDVETSLQEALLSDIGRSIIDGFPPTKAELRAADIELLPVHPSHLAGDLVAQWRRRQNRLPAEGDFLQILPGLSYFCSCHAGRLQRLDGPTIRIANRGPNRQQRRAARRRR